LSLSIVSRNCDESELQLYYNRYFAILRKIIREAKRLYYNHFIDISRYKRKTKWNITRNVTGKVMYANVYKNATRKVRNVTGGI
jgi:hypothetical protein